MKLVVDTDPGVDDALALLYLSSLEEVEVEAVTVVAGNSTQENCLRNANYVSELAGIDAPVYRGSEKPLDRKLETAESHGENGLGDTQVPKDYSKSEGDAVNALIDNADPDKKLLTLGPLTNIAKAVRREPELLEKYKSVTIMGGAVETFGNVNRVSEFNFWVDPKAADIVVNNSSQSSIIVPVDACRKVTVSIDQLRKLQEDQRWKKILKPYIRYYRENTVFEGAVMYDPLAAAITVNPDLANFKKINAVVETEGRETRGMVVTERRPQKDINPNLMYVDSLSQDAEKEILSGLVMT